MNIIDIIGARRDAKYAHWYHIRSLVNDTHARCDIKITLYNGSYINNYLFIDKIRYNDICSICREKLSNKEVRELKHYFIVKKLKS